MRITATIEARKKTPGASQPDAMIDLDALGDTWSDGSDAAPTPRKRKRARFSFEASPGYFKRSKSIMKDVPAQRAAFVDIENQDKHTQHRHAVSRNTNAGTSASTQRRPRPNSKVDINFCEPTGRVARDKSLDKRAGGVSPHLSSQCEQRRKSATPPSAESSDDASWCEEVILDGSHMAPPSQDKEMFKRGRKSPQKRRRSISMQPERWKVTFLSTPHLGGHHDQYENALDSAKSLDDTRQSAASPDVSAKPKLHTQLRKFVSNTRSNTRKKPDQTDVTPIRETGTVPAAPNVTVENDGVTRKPVEMIDIVTCTKDDLDDELYDLINSEDDLDDHVGEGQRAPIIVDSCPRREEHAPASPKVQRESNLYGDERATILPNSLRSSKSDRLNRRDTRRAGRTRTTVVQCDSSSAPVSEQERELHIRRRANKQKVKKREEGRTARKQPTRGMRVEILWEDRSQVFAGVLGRPIGGSHWTFEVHYDDGHIIQENLDDTHWRFEPEVVQGSGHKQDMSPNRLKQSGWHEPGDLSLVESEERDRSYKR